MSGTDVAGGELTGGELTGTELAGAFRAAMAEVCTPVSVVTALDRDRPHGTTVSAFTSLSMDPPMVLVSLARSSDLLEVVSSTGRFGVNVLAHGQADQAMAFAVKGRSKFDGIGWRLRHGLPRLDGAGGWVACSVAGLLDGGDHVVVLGTVLAVEGGGAAPLTYHRRTFGTHAPA
jgi:flavin reductase (DIM6/NTAB) family NADH-FMN oxidoreductase RutF